MSELNVQNHDDGGVSIVGKESVNRLRMTTLLRGIILESETGMQLTRGRSCYAMIKEEYNLKGNKKNIAKQFTKIVRDQLDKAKATSADIDGLLKVGAIG